MHYNLVAYCIFIPQTNSASFQENILFHYMVGYQILGDINYESLDKVMIL